MDFIWGLFIGAVIGPFAWVGIKAGYTIYKQKLGEQVKKSTKNENQS